MLDTKVKHRSYIWVNDGEICHTNHFRNGWNLLNQGLQQFWLVRRGHKIDHKFWQTSLHIPRTKAIYRYNYLIQIENKVYNDNLKKNERTKNKICSKHCMIEKLLKSIVVKSWIISRIFFFFFGILYHKIHKHFKN